MTKKDLYKLSVQISRTVLADFFEAPPSSFEMEANAARKKARKNVYETLAPLLLDKDEG